MSGVQLDESQIMHLPLRENDQSASSTNIAVKAEGVSFENGSAVFDGKQSKIAIQSESGPDLSRPFTLSVHIHTDDDLWDTIGDVISWYDPDARRGMHLSVKTNTAGTCNTPNVRNVMFGIDDGTEPKWTNCGRPGNTRMVHAFQVHDGQLYAAVNETDVDQYGHVYCYEGGDRWTDCGAPDETCSVQSLASVGGQLFASTAFDDLRGSLCEGARNITPGGGVYLYAGDGEWVSCGNPYAQWADKQVPDGWNAIGRIMLFHMGGTLIAGNMHHAQRYRYDGGQNWTPVFDAQFALISAASLNDHLYMMPKALKAEFYPNRQKTKAPGQSILRFTPDGQCEPCGEGMRGQVYAVTKYRGELIAGTWPEGKTYRSATGNNDWVDAGACGCAELEGEVKGEIMTMAVNNGKLYVGTLPLAEVYRYDGDHQWTPVARLDFTPDAPIRRTWSMAEYDGKLFCGTLPGGEVHCMQSGWSVAHNHELSGGWHHLAVVRDDTELRLYVDGELVHTAAMPRDAIRQSPADTPLYVGFGANDYFRGRMRDLKIFSQALNESRIEDLKVARV